jgi:hypothetical protein
MADDTYLQASSHDHANVFARTFNDGYQIDDRLFIEINEDKLFSSFLNNTLDSFTEQIR